MQTPGKKTLLKLTEFGFFSSSCRGNCGSLLFRSGRSVQTHRRHASAGAGGLQRDFCGSHLPAGRNGSHSKPLHSAARRLMLDSSIVSEDFKGANHWRKRWVHEQPPGVGRSSNVYLLVWNNGQLIFLWLSVNEERMGCVRGMRRGWGAEVSSELYFLLPK